MGAVSPPSLNFLLLGNPNVIFFFYAVENRNNFHYTGTQYCAPSCGAGRSCGPSAAPSSLHGELNLKFCEVNLYEYLIIIVHFHFTF